MTFDSLAEFSMPLTIAIEVHILDTERRMIAVLFLCPTTNTLGVCIIFDWETGIASMTDTGLPYVSFRIFRGIWPILIDLSFYLFPGRYVTQKFRATMIGVRLSEDGSAVIVHSEMDECETQKSFSLADLEAEATPWRYTLLSSCPTLKPLEDISFHWRVQAADGISSSVTLSRPVEGGLEMDVQTLPDTASTHSLVGASPLRVWICRQYWPLLPGVPERTSRIVLYDATTPEGTIWRVSQNYSPTGTGDGLSSASDPKTPAPIRFVATIANPVLTSFGQQNLPILGITFNHISWIELVPVRRFRSFGRKRAKRVMKLLTFPEPEAAMSSGPAALPVGSYWDNTDDNIFGESNYEDGFYENGGAGVVKTLDIPERVLDDACHIIVDPTLGTVTITSTSNELYVYRYA